MFREFVTDAAKLVAGYGGSMSGEHGDGRARGELLGLMYTPAAIDTFAAVKHLFDPAELLNPGVIVRPRPMDAELREVAARPMRTQLAFGYPARRRRLHHCGAPLYWRRKVPCHTADPA